MPAKKQITKDMILKSAFKLMKEQGYEAVNIKKLAEELGCSTQPVYLSFSGMDELRSELVPLAIAEFERQVKSRDDSIARLYGIEYVYFAENEPHLFRFLFMRENAFSEIRRILMPIIGESVRELSEIYHISRDEADALHDQLWMHAHGIAAMIATEFCDWDMDKVSAMLAECKYNFTKKYEA